MGEATMRKSCAKLSLVACLAGLTAVTTSAQAQVPPNFSSGHSYGAPAQQQQCGDPVSATVLPNDGSPNAFADPKCCWTEPVFWGAADYLLGITRRAPGGVPLFTTSTNLNTSVGAIGEPGTVVLAGALGPDLQYPQGMRFTLGFSPTRAWAIPFEVVYTYMHQEDDLFGLQSDVNGNPLLARPINSADPNNPGQKIAIVSFPGLFSGSAIENGSIQLWGLQTVGVIRTNLQCGDDCCGFGIYLPVGFRYLNLNEGVNIGSSTTVISSNATQQFLGNFYGLGSQTVVTDLFKANNEFRGAEFGIRFVGRFDGLCVLAEPRISIGATQQAVTISGQSVLNDTAEGGGIVNAPGGLLALPSNSGRFARERFTYLPEGSFSLHWQCFPWMGIQAGYNITYWPNVQRASSAINPNVDLRQAPTSSTFDPTVTSTSPSFIFRESTFWMQDVTVGVVFSF
jgi:Putative beta barrel porin-7 (BBP7)